MLQIRFASLKAFLKELSKRYNEDQVSALSTKLTFYITLSAFPLTIILLEIIRLTHLSDTGLFLEITEFVPHVVLEFVQYIFDDVKLNTSDSILPLATITTLWSASKGVNALIYSLNRAYRINMKPNFILMRMTSLLYTIAFVLILVLTGSLVIFGNRIYHLSTTFFNFPDSFKYFVILFRYLFSFLLSVLFFSGLYNLPLKGIQIKKTLPGTMVATFGWIGFSSLFSIYINYSTSLSYMYGSLTDIIIVLLWLNITSNLIIIGGEVNAILHKQSSKRTDPS